MNKLLFSKKSIFLLFIGIVATFSSCVDQEFDLPPEPELDPAFSNVITITELVNDFYKAGAYTKVTDSVAISGIVIADDESGNYFKELVIQDETGGIEVQLNAIGLHDDYPIGRRIYVNCKDLWIGDFAGSLQLGGSYDEDNDRLNRIDEVLISQVIAKGPVENSIVPKEVEINELTTADVNTLVRLTNQQFASSEVGETFADFPNRTTTSAVNRTIEDCAGNEIILRTSSYSDFAESTIPDGNGTITAVFSVFNETPQLFIRDLSDIEFDLARCQKGGGTGNEELASIASIRDLFTGSETTVPADTKIKGIVISDKDNANITNRNLVIQEPGGKGIILRFAEAHPYSLGDELEVAVSEKELSEFNGLLQINNLNLGDASVLSTEKEITPSVLTVVEILANAEDLESTLVTIQEAMIVGGGSYGGSSEVQDATGKIALFGTSYSSFANVQLERATVAITAIVSQFNDPQINIRNLNDVVKTGGGGGNTGGDSIFDIDFEDQEDFEPIALDGWQNIALTGTRLWLGRSFDENSFTEARAFQEDSPEIDTWLISPELDLTQITTLEFESATAFWVHDGLSVLFSSDFDGTNVETATWENLETTLAGQGNPNYNWVDSGAVTLPTGAKGYVAFRYVGTSATNTTTYRLDNIQLR